MIRSFIQDESRAKSLKPKQEKKSGAAFEFTSHYFNYLSIPCTSRAVDCT